MEEIISKKELEELKTIEGKVRGTVFKESKEFIFKEEGKEGIQRLENAMASLDFSEYKKIKTMDFYPLWLYAIFLLVIKKLFNYDDEKFEKLGSLGAKFSLIIRIAMKYFVSLDRIFKGALTLWKMYYTVGDLKIIEYDKEKKYAIGRLENFRFTPLHCPILKGYLSGMIGMVIKSPVSCEETKCLFQGDEYDEFLFKW